MTKPREKGELHRPRRKGEPAEAGSGSSRSRLDLR